MKTIPEKRGLTWAKPHVTHDDEDALRCCVIRKEIETPCCMRQESERVVILRSRNVAFEGRLFS